MHFLKCNNEQNVIMSIFPTAFVVQLPLAQHYFVVLMGSTVLPIGPAAMQQSPGLSWCTCTPLLLMLHKPTIKRQSAPRD